MNLTPLEARSHYQKMINNTPQDPKGYLGMGDLAFFSGFYEDARPFYEQTIDLEPENLEGWIGLAKIEIHYESMDQAEEYLIQALNISPSNHEVLILAGFTSISLAKYSAGLKYLGKIVDDKQSPYNSLASFLFGHLKCLLGDPELGVHFFTMCKDLPPFSNKTNPNFQILENNYGVGSLRSDKYLDAENRLRSITQTPSSCNSRMWLNLAIAYWIQDKIDESLTIFEKIHSIDPDLWPWKLETGEYRKNGANWLKNASKGLKTESSVYNISMFLGCVIPNRYPFIEASTRYLLDALNVGVAEMEGAGCCPAPGVFKSFDIESWLTVGARNLTISEKMNRDLITMCNGCYGTLNDVNTDLKEDGKKAAMVNEHLKNVNREFKGTIEVRHLLDVLINEIGLDTIKSKITHPLSSLRVAVHYGCHLLKPMKNKPWVENWENPTFFDELVEITGAKSVPYKDKMMCCGAGGGVRGGMKEVSLSYTFEKLTNMRNVGIDAIVVCCPFCHLQFDIGQLEVNKLFQDKIGKNFKIPVIYISQLLGLAMGIDPFRMCLLKTPKAKGLPPMQPFEFLFTNYQNLDLHHTSLFSNVKTNN